MAARVTNIFADVPRDRREELIEALVSAPGLRIERIVSAGQASPPGFWYDQDWAEWVLVLAGSAGLEFEGEAAPRRLRPGDCVLIAAHARHRVAWTDPDQPTVWLAVHFEEL
jgi:cupin 2 domain-containing protein